MSTKPAAVLFVCLGNICRSPTAHGVFQAKLDASDLAGRVEVDSCGTGGWHRGDAPDERACAAALKRGYDLSTLRARQLCAEDFERFDYILAMDAQNLVDIRQHAPKNYAGHIALFLDFAPSPSEQEVPDPYYGGEDGFDYVLDLIEQASDGLLRELSGAAPA